MNKFLSLAVVALAAVGISLANPARSDAGVYARGTQPQPRNYAPSYFNNNYGYYSGNYGVGGYGYGGFGFNSYNGYGFNAYGYPAVWVRLGLRLLRPPSWLHPPSRLGVSRSIRGINVISNQ
jgi:hypothetical protein